MAKPMYNLARGEAELTDQLRPPFSFKDVTARVFPLSADMDRLAEYCDSYLNFVPPEIAQFRPAVPYVYLMVVDYGEMKSRKARGWIAQKEVAFLVPLKWSRVEGGHTAFVDWAWACPYIFVDDDISLMTGRQVYGWSKIPAAIDDSSSEAPATSESSVWGSQPHRDSQLLTVSLPEVRLSGIGLDTGDHRLLTIHHESGPNFSLIQSDFPNPFQLLRGVLQTTQGVVSAARDWFDALPGLASLSYPSLPDLQAINIITLKEFRDTTNPEEICYQALVSSQLGVNKYIRGGLLGDVNPLRGDLSSGFRINLYRPPCEDKDLIVDTLGLDAEYRLVEENHAATLKSVSPFWATVELEYGNAHTLCWRAKGTEWYRGSTFDSPLNLP